MKFKFAYFSLILLILTLFNCKTPDREQDEAVRNDTSGMEQTSSVAIFNTDQLTGAQAKSLVGGLPEKVLSALAQADFDQLAQYVHPVKGVRFSPYAHVDTAEQVVLQPQQLGNIPDTTYTWGYEDGSGDPIRMNFHDYYEEYIYDADFQSADSIYYNKELQHGNTINNSFEIYDHHVIAEYFINGQDPQFGGMDWKALRLVFERYQDQWHLVGIIHSQWTI
ncbi:MAG: hypothetical protein ACNS62_10170 [Candidatus Cyclobacteriaceae bacterium M3_2C_046]